jgi:Family of unknown function (DUF6233)
VYENVPTERLETVLRFLEHITTPLRDELARRHAPPPPAAPPPRSRAEAGWAVEYVRHPSPGGPELRVHHGDCPMALLNHDAEPIGAADARGLLARGAADACDCTTGT